VGDQIRKAQTGERKSQFLKQAQASIDARQFDRAIQVLEAAAIECGDSPDIASLMNYARENERKVELGQLAANAIREAQPLIAAGQFEAAINLLEPVALKTGDPSVDQLLRKATSGRTESARRVDAVVSRAQALGENNIGQAIQLLSSQPQDIRQHPRVRELHARLDAAIEQETAIAEAIRNAADSLEKRDLHSGLDVLESVRGAYGDSPRISSAIAAYQSKRAQIANGLLAAAIEAANQALHKNDQPRAAEALAGAATVAEFADPGLQANVKRLTDAVQKAPKRQTAPASEPVTAAYEPVKIAPQPAKAASALLWALLIGVIVVVLLAAAGAAYWFFLRPAPAVVQLGALEVNATPFAEVVSVTSDKGKAIPLPAGDHFTPLRLDGIPLGTYAVQVKGADGAAATQSCVVDQSGQVCSFELKPIDDQAIEEIVGGAK